MATTITDEAMTSTDTRHTARRTAAGWELSWLPGRMFGRDQAISGMTLAEAVAHMQTEGLTSVVDHSHRLWPFIDRWAAELGLSGPDAVVRVSDPNG